MGPRASFLAVDLSKQHPIIRPLKRPDTTKANIDTIFNSTSFRDLVAERLSGAVQVPTVTYDDMGMVGEDDKWNIFYDIIKYLRDTFPMIYEALTVETINEHALLHIWPGSNASLKPLLFMAHTDVVPAPSSTSSRWTYPPFSGHFDGKFVWGRGSEDDKSNLIAILSTITALLEAGFEPERTVCFAVGFDEEGGARVGQGASALAARMLEIYGEDGVELIFDEGVPGIKSFYGTEFALPGTSEKGYCDVMVTINTAGGHSSTPPDHNAIGYAALIIQAIENNQFPAYLTANNPTTRALKQAALHSKDMPSDLRQAILDPERTDEVLEYFGRDQEMRANFRTSTAVDVIHGGVKSNVLPETVTLLVNHRIAVEESVQAVKDHYIRVLSPLVESLNFSMDGFGNEMIKKGKEKAGTVTLTSTHEDLEPSPVTDTDSEIFGWLGGVIKSVFGEHVIVAPCLSVGNTDTKYYWKLSNQIYRFSPFRASGDPRGTTMHTVDERMSVDGLLDMCRFYHEFIRVMDEKWVDESLLAGNTADGWCIVRKEGL